MSFGGYIKAFGKMPGHPFHAVWIRNDLKEMQRFIDGFIEPVQITDDIAVICNEDGRLLGMPHNCEICGIDFCGPLLIVGVKGDEFTDIPEGALEFIEQNTEE